NAAAELLELLRLAQELDNLFQLFLGFIDAGHILEGDLLLLHGEQARPALAERQRLVPAALHLADHEEPQQRDQDQRRELQQPGPPAVAVVVLHHDIHLVLVEDIEQVGVVGRDKQMERALVSPEVPVHFGAGNGYVRNLARFNIAQELREIDLLLVTAHHVVLLEQLPENQQTGDDQHPEQDLLNG